MRVPKNYSTVNGEDKVMDPCESDALPFKLILYI